MGNENYKIAIHGTAKGDRETPHVHIYIDGFAWDETTYKEKIYVQSAADIESAKVLLRKYADEENKNTWSYTGKWM